MALVRLRESVDAIFDWIKISGGVIDKVTFEQKPQRVRNRGTDQSWGRTFQGT